MSDNVPTMAPPAHRKSKRKFDRRRLPTPPPDPTEIKTEERDDFFAYLEALQKNCYARSTSAFAPVMATEDAFDHLEKLYKLMEQMLELREQNAKLHRRVRDLEHLNNLEKMRKQLDEAAVQGDCTELEKDTAFAETILESILAEAKAAKLKPSPSKLHQSISRRQRHRSGSATDKALEPYLRDARRASTCVDSRQGKSAKVSKWTKVKAAFRWEKASPTVSDAKSQDSGIGGLVPVNLEVARYLRVPSMSDDAAHSPADSGAAEISTPGSLSTASSTEDFVRNELRSPCEDFKSSDDEHLHNYIPRSKEGSQKSMKPYKTPWAKMKDIIQTRNSFKKKHRLSAQSDDIQIDVELCSDNEDVFEDDKSKSQNTDSPVVCPKDCTRTNSKELPPEVMARYQQAVIDDGNVLDYNNLGKTSKWDRVKKAFLTPIEINPQNTFNRDYPKSIDDSRNLQDEIHRNYKQLQKKLSLEFQEKLFEWERMKQNSPGMSNSASSSNYIDENRDLAFTKKLEEWEKIKSQSSKNKNFQMNEDNLPPYFRKKLQEWEKIKKSSAKESSSKKKLGEVPRCKSLSSQKSDNSPVFEYPPITEDFKKKLEEWKQIKSGGGTITSIDDKSNKTPSPRLSRKDSSPKYSKKHKETHDKELQWFEKELSKIEKEKQRLERERQKFMDREERLSKLRNSVMGGLKKEVLIHTPSGFYRFEGISRKFTQKLYEWEKAQGIGPESSTFALLNSSYNSEVKPTVNTNISGTISSLSRSKSVDSIAISALNLTCPLMSHQPSSLSLNNVDDLEKECLGDSKSSSIQFNTHCHETIPADEPEAIIVEVEDIVEETAAPLRTFPERTEQAVYQRQKLKAMCEGETCAAPKVRRSESARAQNNYNLMEEIFALLKTLTQNEFEIEKTQDDQALENNIEIVKLRQFQESQLSISSLLLNKVIHLQEANSNVVSDITKEKLNYNLTQIVNVLDAVQEFSTEVFHLVEKLNVEINNRNIFEHYEAAARSCSPIVGIIKDIRMKMLELRRHLSYVCAASDLTAPCPKRLIIKEKSTSKIQSKEQIEDFFQSKNDTLFKEGRMYIKSETSNIQSQGAIKKRIRYRQKTAQSRSIPDTDDDEEEDEGMDQKRNKPKKLVRTRSTSDNSSGRNDNKETELQRAIVNDAVVQKVVVPTEVNFVKVNDTQSQNESDSPVTVFVKTTRKLFTPIIEGDLTDMGEYKKASEDNKTINSSTDHEIECEKDSITHLPPLPVSPIPQKKILKEISPSIRLMLAKYNQKISEQDFSCKSGGSSGSASPVAWRSPSAERRVKARTEKYQEELNKLSPLLGRGRELQKSTSVNYMHNKQITMPQRNTLQTSQSCSILKSPSTTTISSDNLSKNTQQSPKLTLTIDKDSSTSILRHSPEIRQKKLQRAKEEFLNATPASAPPKMTDSVKFPDRSRLSQISVDSETSYESNYATNLIKSASAGMINIDAELYKQFDPEIHCDGYVSLPRTTRKQNEGLLGGKFAFLSIASKFRKVKMRKGKDREHNKMNTVSTLCRQSLVVDISSNNNVESRTTSSEDVSVTSSKSGLWLRRPKLFKK